MFPKSGFERKGRKKRLIRRKRTKCLKGHEKDPQGSREEVLEKLEKFS